MDYKKQYTDHFNKIGTSAKDSATMIADYERNTKGLDQAQAFEALEGGRQFDPSGGDMARYKAISTAKERGQNYQSANMKQNVQQDNDINTSITGDNNYVNNQQDNSIRQYGGDTRQFVYNSAGGDSKNTETPASAATMAGFYDVNDSPAKQAKFMDLYSTLNSDSQKKYGDTSYIAQGAINRAANNRAVDTGALDRRIYEREQYDYAKSDMLGKNLFGDRYGAKTPNWKNPERQTEVEKPDFEEMYDKYTDF